MLNMVHLACIHMKAAQVSHVTERRNSGQEINPQAVLSAAYKNSNYPNEHQKNHKRKVLQEV